MSSVLRKYKHENESKGFEAITEYSLEQSLQVIDKALAEIYKNISHSSVISKVIKTIFLLPKPCNEANVLSDKLTFKIVKNIAESNELAENLFTNIYTSGDTDDRLNALTMAFEESRKAHTIIKKVKIARKKYDEALNENILSQEEYKFIIKWEEDVAKVIQVDDFPLKSTAFDL